MKKMMLGLCMVAMLFGLCACGGGGGVKGETYDVGEFTVLCPDGWKAYQQKEMWAEEGVMATDEIILCKGGKEDMDTWTKPIVTISYENPDSEMTPPQSTFYDDAMDLESAVTIGERSWEGFTAKTMDRPITVIWTLEPDQFQITLSTPSDQEEIKLEDADVNALIASLAVK